MLTLTLSAHASTRIHIETFKTPTSGCAAASYLHYRQETRMMNLQTPASVCSAASHLYSGSWTCAAALCAYAGSPSCATCCCVCGSREKNRFQVNPCAVWSSPRHCRPAHAAAAAASAVVARSVGRRQQKVTHCRWRRGCVPHPHGDLRVLSQVVQSLLVHSRVDSWRRRHRNLRHSTSRSLASHSSWGAQQRGAGGQSHNERRRQKSRQGRWGCRNLVAQLQIVCAVLACRQ